MSKFKVGDKVKRTEGIWFGMHAGDTATIKNVRNIFIDLNEFSGGHNIDNFILVNHNKTLEGLLEVLNV